MNKKMTLLLRYTFKEQAFYLQSSLLIWNGQFVEKLEKLFSLLEEYSLLCANSKQHEAKQKIAETDKIARDILKFPGFLSTAEEIEKKTICATCAAT